MKKIGKRKIEKVLTKRDRLRAAERQAKLADYERSVRESIQTPPASMMAQMLPNHVYERVLRVVDELTSHSCESISFSLLGSIESIEGSCDGHTGAVILWTELVRALRERFLSHQIGGRRGEWSIDNSATIERGVKCDQCGRERNGWRWEGERKNTPNPVETDGVFCPQCKHDEQKMIAGSFGDGRDKEQEYDAGNTGLRWRDLVANIPKDVLPTILTRVLYKVDPTLAHEWLSMLHDGIAMVDIQRLCEALGREWRDSGLFTLERRPGEVRRLRRLRAAAKDAALRQEEAAMVPPLSPALRARRREAVA